MNSSYLDFNFGWNQKSLRFSRKTMKAYRLEWNFKKGLDLLYKKIVIEFLPRYAVRNKNRIFCPFLIILVFWLVFFGHSFFKSESKTHEKLYEKINVSLWQSLIANWLLIYQLGLSWKQPTFDGFLVKTREEKASIRALCTEFPTFVQKLCGLF